MSNLNNTSNNDLRVVVLASGQGSTLMSIVNSVNNGTLPINLVGVVSNKSKQYHSGLINLVKNAGINIENLNYSDYQNRSEFEKRLHFVCFGFAPHCSTYCSTSLPIAPNRSPNGHFKRLPNFVSKHNLLFHWQGFQVLAQTNL